MKFLKSDIKTNVSSHEFCLPVHYEFKRTDCKQHS